MTKRIRAVEGRVISDKNDKTITVLVESSIQHKLYKKLVRRTKKYHAHDEKNVAHDGDLVRIQESRPLSKTKTWVLEKVIETSA